MTRNPKESSPNKESTKSSEEETVECALDLICETEDMELPQVEVLDEESGYSDSESNKSSAEETIDSALGIICESDKTESQGIDILNEKSESSDKESTQSIREESAECPLDLISKTADIEPQGNKVLNDEYESSHNEYTAEETVNCVLDLIPATYGEPESTNIKRDRKTRCSVSSKLDAIARVKQNESRASICRSLGKFFLHMKFIFPMKILFPIDK